MKKIVILHLDGCPYCRNARKAIEELKAANGEYGKLEIQWIEEEQQPEQAKAYAQDYYYVPSMFVDGKKLYEAHPGESYEECRAKVQQVFDAAL